MNKNQYVAIMAGGIGSRFWPVSRTHYPKQFLDILNTGKTLIQWTYERFAQFIPKENILVVTSHGYEGLVVEQLPDMLPENILVEPSRKNTAACIAYVAFRLQQIDPEAILICAPADHIILDVKKFHKVCYEALDFVKKNNAFITLGINPTHPNTGYGYIQYEHHAVGANVYKVKTFTEKPDKELATTFLASGDFLWNSGIFVWKLKNLLPAFEKYLPEMYELFVAGKENFNTEKEKETIEHIYPRCAITSIDLGIIEKAENVYVIPSSFGWSDLGTWNSAYDNMDKDEHENAVSGSNVTVIDATRCIVKAPDNKLVVLQGLEEYIVIDTPDVLLICSKDKEQEIKDYVSEIKRKKGDKYL